MDDPSEIARWCPGCGPPAHEKYWTIEICGRHHEPSNYIGDSDDVFYGFQSEPIDDSDTGWCRKNRMFCNLLHRRVNVNGTHA